MNGRGAGEFVHTADECVNLKHTQTYTPTHTHTYILYIQRPRVGYPQVENHGSRRQKEGGSDELQMLWVVLESQSLQKEEKAGMEKKGKKKNRKQMKTMKWMDNTLCTVSTKRVNEQSRPGFPKQANTLIIVR